MQFIIYFPRLALEEEEVTCGYYSVNSRSEWQYSNFAKTNQNHLNSSVIWIYESHPSFPEFLLPGQASLTVMEKKVIFPSVLVCLLLLLFVIVVNENTPDIHLQFRTEIIIQHTQVALLRGVCGAVRYSVQIISISASNVSHQYFNLQKAIFSPPIF